MQSALIIDDIQAHEFTRLGQIMVEVYANLHGFPSPDEQPEYYKMLANIGDFSLRDGIRVLVAKSAEEGLIGGVVYFGDMADYGSGGIATTLKHAAGMRLLGIRPDCRNLGAGKALTMKCIELAREGKRQQMILHTTQAMQVAWGLYEKLGFKRAEELDFLQQGFPVFGFKLRLG